MDFDNLTKENKADIKDTINYHYGVNIITSVCSAKLNNTTLIIYQDRERKDAIHIDYQEFKTLFNQLILGA
jgi:hypothetical protein